MKVTTADRLAVELDKIIDRYKSLCKSLVAAAKLASEGSPEVGPPWHSMRNPVVSSLHDALKSLENANLDTDIRRAKEYLQDRYFLKPQVYELQNQFSEMATSYMELSSEANDQPNYEAKKLLDRLCEIIYDNNGTWSISEREENDDE